MDFGTLGTAGTRGTAETLGTVGTWADLEAVRDKYPWTYRVVADQPRRAAVMRSNSATLHAWAAQPRGACGGSASNISEICPVEASTR